MGISSEENKTKSMLEEKTQKHFLETVKRDNTGSSDQIEETEKFISEAKEILSSAHFNLRCWLSNMSVPMIDSTESKPQSVPVLGLIWDTQKDTLNCKITEPVQMKESYTKRQILSATHKIYDPIGFTAPLTLIPKLILQQTRIQKIKWDQQLPPNLSKHFSTWIKQLDLLPKIEIPRWLNIDYQNEYITILHIFSDASKQAFATCAFLRTENKEGVQVQLVNTGSRVAPIKEMTIPRLELLSCLIGARLARTILTDLSIVEHTSTALGWMRRDQAWGTFVHNRVQEIRTSTKISDWKHVPGKYNPADLPSRGCSFEQLMESRW
ncbi:uncharacterized protein [Parasteatoda tepidariorum]|uniref:uncharacterized protein n=1 Tax=Parasteatoda tepidariorum TaxID=114398 RepID=UPI0039BCBE6B